MKDIKDIKFVFISNYLNHHQIPFCNEMYALLGGSFAFIQTERVEQERIHMGWQEKSEQPYLKLYYEEPEACRKWIDSCAVALFGGSDEESYIRPRLAQNKPVIRYSERIYKTGQWKAISPRGLKKKYYDHTCYRKKPVYLLCAGAYVPSDFHIVRAYPQKMLKWGYFPETRLYDVDKLMWEKGWRLCAAEDGAAEAIISERSQARPAYLLWAARMIDWKHPELPLKTAKYLRDKGYSFHLDMVGGGELAETVKRLVMEYGIEDVVTLRGYCPPEKVRSLMERADIYLATSDRQEGWGAVVNEAMNSGCAVVGDHMMGAVPYLIRHGENGMIYEDGREGMLYQMTELLVKDRALCERLGRNAISTITEEWNGEKAAERLAAFCVGQGFLQEADLCRTVPQAAAARNADTEAPSARRSASGWSGAGEELSLLEQGPCSIAPVISERKMYRLLMEQGQACASRRGRLEE